ncbi:MAG: transcriptional repressor [Candidatus Brocadia sp.]|jgi:Fur family peroxide stress response transcriptional regulator|nr:transcriptional repressor [Candidatus Brocadia sp.]MCE7910340.1 transcriptional repressor [Candidatus Brocadia sp. AMX3]OQZ02191.1 MAG: transcriptional repressor [Candidatus Brocadia sp. UTAMX2]MDG5997170.1 transcriptional repressor [Candidatus Brocadia sp.]RIK03167.1 MAG: transcriptional repressor [Candidatus Brocadia sp.]
METIEKLTKKLRSQGMKITPQRLMIFKVLENNTSHPSAENVYKRVKRIYPSVSFTTIYKTLETLRELGEVREFVIDGDRKHYDPNTNLHHHVICSSCKRILDVFEDFSPSVKLPDAVKKDYAVSGFQIFFHGICKECN